MACEISRARLAQTSRLEALRGLRAGSAAPEGVKPAPLSCVLPLTSTGGCDIQNLVASPSGHSAAVIFTDSTAQGHPLIGCVATARLLPQTVVTHLLPAFVPRSGSAVPDAAEVRQVLPEAPRDLRSALATTVPRTVLCYGPRTPPRRLTSVVAPSLPTVRPSVVGQRHRCLQPQSRGGRR